MLIAGQAFCRVELQPIPRLQIFSWCFLFLYQRISVRVQIPLAVSINRQEKIKIRKSEIKNR